MVLQEFAIFGAHVAGSSIPHYAGEVNNDGDGDDDGDGMTYFTHRKQNGIIDLIQSIPHLLITSFRGQLHIGDGDDDEDQDRDGDGNDDG